MTTVIIMMRAMPLMKHLGFLNAAALTAGSKGEESDEEQSKTGFHNGMGDGFTETGQLQVRVTSFSVISTNSDFDQLSPFTTR